MPDNYRHFIAGPDPFGRKWNVEFKWLQTGTSIRHADTVDVKFGVEPEGEQKQEKVLALPLPALLALSKDSGHPLTDGWCLKLAARHLIYMVESAEDLEKTLVTLSEDDLKRASGILQAA